MASYNEAQRRLSVLDEIAALKAERSALLARAEQTRFSGYRDKPVEFAEEVLGITLWRKQREILQALYRYRRVVVSSSFASGKSFGAGALVCQWVATHPSAIAITTASTDRQVTGQLWGEIRKNFRRGVKLPGRMSPDPGAKLPGDLLPKAPEWTVTPGENFALGFSTNDPNRFAGWHGGRVLVVLDEAEGIADEMWEIMEGQLSTGDVAVLALGNPDPEGSVGGFQKAASSALWHHITISAFDTPNLVAGRDDVAPYLVTKRWVDERRIEWGEDHPLWVTKVLGQFVEGSAAKLVLPLAWFEAAVDRPGVSAVSDAPVGGLDIARYGADSTALAIRQGAVIVHLDKVHGFDGVQVGGWTVAALRAAGCKVLHGDSTGLGGPVLDFIRQAAPEIRVHDVNAGESPNDRENFVRRRDELWWAARERFETDRLVLPLSGVGKSGLPKAMVDQLKAQMVQVRYHYRPDGRKYVEGKDEMARRGLPSPDLADALCLACLGPAVVRTNLSALRNTRR